MTKLSRIFAIFFVGMSAIEAWAEPPRGNKVDVRPLRLEDLATEAAATRQSLLEQIHEIKTSQLAHQALGDELQAAFDGTPGMALQINVVRLQSLHDEVRQVDPLVRLSEHLRFNLAALRTEKQRRQKEVDEAAKQAGGQVIAIAEKLLRQGEKTEDVEAARSLEAEMLQHIFTRDEAAARSAAYAGDITEIDGEQQQINKLGSRFGSWQKQVGLQAERYLAAVEHESDRLIEDALGERRDALREAIATTEAHWAQRQAPATIPSSQENPVRRGPQFKVGEAGAPPQLNVRERELVKKELDAVRKRLMP